MKKNKKHQIVEARKGDLEKIDPITKRKYDNPEELQRVLYERYGSGNTFEYGIKSKKQLQIYLNKLKDGILLYSNIDSNLTEFDYMKKIYNSFEKMQIWPVVEKVINQIKSAYKELKKRPLSVALRNLTRGVVGSNILSTTKLQSFNIKNTHGVLFYFLLDIFYSEWITLDFENSPDPENHGTLYKYISIEKLNDVFLISMKIDLTISQLIDTFNSLFSIYENQINNVVFWTLKLFSVSSSIAYKTHKIKIKVPNEDSEYIVRLDGVNNKFPELFIIIDEIGVQWKQYLQTLSLFLQQVLNQNIKIQKFLVEYRKIAYELITAIKMPPSDIQTFVFMFEPLMRRVEKLNNSPEFMQINKKIISHNRNSILSIEYSLKRKEIKIKELVERFNEVFHYFSSTFKQ